MKTDVAGTTTIRIRKATQERLKRIAAGTGVSVTELVEHLVERHEESFWDGFDGEAMTALSTAEKKTRKSLEGVLSDGLEGAPEL